MNDVADALPVLRPDWPAPDHVRACVTLRGGGISVGPYASLNLGTHVGDDPECVAANRARVRASLSLPAEPAWLEQVHGTDIVDLDRDPGRRADGATTMTPGVICAVLTADCLPVLLCDRAGTRVAVAHAGWRGLAAGVLERAVAAFGGPGARLMAWLGPAISAAAYEVGDDVRSAFTDAEAQIGFTRNARGRWQADLATLACSRLRRSGVRDVYVSGQCTVADGRRYFSHRRDAPCGRFATLVWLDAAVLR